jgi:hypothetical protein
MATYVERTRPPAPQSAPPVRESTHSPLGSDSFKIRRSSYRATSTPSSLLYSHKRRQHMATYKELYLAISSVYVLVMAMFSSLEILFGDGSHTLRCRLVSASDVSARSAARRSAARFERPSPEPKMAPSTVTSTTNSALCCGPSIDATR